MFTAAFVSPIYLHPAARLPNPPPGRARSLPVWADPSGPNFRVRRCAPLLSASPSKPSTPDPPPSPPHTPDPLQTGQLGALKVICFGETLSDHFSTNPHALDTNLAHWTAFSGGCPANVAVTLTALGISSAMVGHVGGDATGRALKDGLRTRGVNVDGLLVVPNESTRRVFVRTRADGEREFVGYGGLNGEFADARHIDVDSISSALFDTASVLVTGTMGLAFAGSAAGLRKIVSIAALCKLCVVIDVNWRPGIWADWTDEKARMEIQTLLCEGGVSVVKGSVDDLAFVYGRVFAEGALERPQAVLDAIGGGVRCVLVTDGERGAAYAIRGPDSGKILAGRVEAELLPASKVVDTTGAGDAFVAGFVAAMIELGGEGAFCSKRKVRAMVQMAVKTAAFVVQAVGPTERLPSEAEADEIKSTSLDC